MTQKEILEIFQKTGAILDGHFNLSSGLHSPKYLQCAKVLQYPEYAAKLCEALAEKFKKQKINTVIAPALGGIIVSHETARALGVKGIFAERQDGKMKLRRGFNLEKNEKCLVVEDVITTGLSTGEVIKLVKSHGAEVMGIGCIIDRSAGEAKFESPLNSLTQINIPTFRPDECPLCKEGKPITKPGSRK